MSSSGRVGGRSRLHGGLTGGLGVVGSRGLPALWLLGVAMLLPGCDISGVSVAHAQAAPASISQIGTVKAISGSTITLATDAGQTFKITVDDGAKVVQLAPGSKDLKSAKVIALTEITTGDRVLATGKTGDTATTFTAARVILMKSTDLAEEHAAEQADWQKRGSGGLVTAVDSATGVVTITVSSKKIDVNTTSSTIYRRYAGDSVEFKDAVASKLTQIQVGDQLRVLGTKSSDGTSIAAEQIVSGSFKNLAGLIASIDPAAGTLTLKDLATKKTYTVKVTANSNVRALPPEMAARFAARARGASGASGAPGGAAPAAQPTDAGQSGTRGQYAGGGARGAGMDLSQMLGRLPTGTLAQLHTGAAVMLVASQPDPGSDALTAVTLLSGVEPILAATPSGSPAMTLSPWNMGGMPEGAMP